MSPYSNTPTLEQLPLINIASTTWQKDSQRRKKQVESTLARIRQLHDELNAQLYAHPAERPQINSPADAFQIMDYFIGMLDHEEIWVMDLDTRNRVMSLIKVTQGSVNSSIVRVSEIYRQAVLEMLPGSYWHITTPAEIPPPAWRTSLSPAPYTREGSSLILSSWIT